MNKEKLNSLLYLGLVGVAIIAPLVFPNFRVQLTFLWLMIVFALTWDLLGGQMGYNSFGNITFVGIGVYTATIAQIGLYHNVADYTSAYGTMTLEFTRGQYFTGFVIGLVAAPLIAVPTAAILGSCVLSMRGQYFAIATLGLGIAAGELAAAWGYLGGSFGIQVPVFPGEVETRSFFFYTLAAVLGLVTLWSFRWLYRTRFGLALNAIRDDEDKAESMGLRTTPHKTLGWCIAAFFLSLAGGILGHVVGYIEPREVAFAGTTYGVWMVLMAILGGKGTLWGPVLGATIFYVTKELFWTYLFGWQRVALGLLIVVIVVFFPVGILGWAQARYPTLFARYAEPER